MASRKEAAAGAPARRAAGMAERPALSHKKPAEKTLLSQRDLASAADCG